MSEPVPVLHVIEAMHTGGAESMVIELVRGASPGFRPLVCALNRGGPALETVAATGAGTWVLGKGGRRAWAIRSLVRLMRSERVGVVHAHNPTGALYAMTAARLASVPVRVRTEHSIRYPGRHSPFYPVLERLITRSSQRVICVCEAVRASHRVAGIGAEKLVVVENGIGPTVPARDRAAVRADLGEPAGAPVALAVGSLTPQKAHGELLEALAVARRSVPDARLWIAGEGRLRAELEEQGRALGLQDSVRLLGPRSDVVDLLGAADVFVLSSRREGLSITLLEALRAGRASLVTDVGGSADVVGSGSAGLVVPPAQPAELGRALARLMGDSSLRERLGAAAQLRWRQRFTAERMVAETEGIYTALLAGRMANRHRR